MSARYDYSEWDGTQEFADLDPDDLLAGLTDDLLAGGDLDDALRRLLRSGFRTADGDEVAGLRDLPEAERPTALICQSATGYYGPRGSEQLDEGAAPGNDFLAGVVREWEQEALAAAPSCRVVVSRTGVVLAAGGGALAKMLPFFRAGVGGPVAGGHQFVPWIHIDDVVDGLLFCLENSSTDGPINLTAPRPVENSELSKALGRVLRRPAVLPVPAAALKLLYGEMSQIVLTGQRVVPHRLEALGFSFRYPELEGALRDVLGTR